MLKTAVFAKGADIGWLHQMEATGYKFYNEKGVEEDCFKILRDHGINTIRLRTWVNPSNSKTSGPCSKDETVAMAVRAKKWDMRVMINFHYSDSWADPGKQKKPAAYNDRPNIAEGIAQVYLKYKKAGVPAELLFMQMQLMVLGCVKKVAER